MPNRFGLKDVVVIALLLGIAVSIWLGMVQRDRQWDRLLAIDARLATLEQQSARIESRLEAASSQSGLLVGMNVAGGPGAAMDASAPVGASGPDGGADHVDHVDGVDHARRAHGTRGAAPTSSASASGSSDASHESWARPGIAIHWQPPWTFATDPRTQPGFAPGGEFIEIFEVEPRTVTPYISTDVYGRRVQDRVCETLGAFDARTLELRGLLADAWQVDPDQRWIRVHINPRARFSDGRPVTADDVRWTWHEYVANPLVDAARTRSTFDGLDEVRVIDERTVEFVYSKSLFNNLDSTLSQLQILPRHIYERFDPAQLNRSTSLLAGSGQYRLAVLDPDRQWTPGEPIVLERNEQYWGVRPPFDRLRYKVIRDEAVRLKAYESGDGDMITPSSVQYELKRSDAEFQRRHLCLDWYNMRSSYTVIVWQCGDRDGRPTPFADRRVRLAMTQILDRDRMIRDIWGGVGKVATAPMVSQSPTNDPSITPWPFDLAAATALLAEAGWRDPNGSGRLRNAAGEPFRFEFTIPQGGEVSERIVAYVKDQCAKVGIECTIRMVDWPVYTEVGKSRDFDALIIAWSPTLPESDMRQVFHSSQILDQGDNMMQWNSPEADRLIEAIRAAFDVARRMELWHEFHALIHAEQPFTFVREAPWLRFVRRDVGNVHPYRSGLEVWEFFRLSGGVEAPAAALAPPPAAAPAPTPLAPPARAPASADAGATVR